MSTKIFDAYRFTKRGTPWETLWAIRDKAIENIEAQCLDFYRHRMENIIYTEDDFKGDPNDWTHRLTHVHEATLEAVKKQANSMRRNDFDVDVSIKVAPYKGRFYLRAFCDHVSVLVGGCLNFLDEHPALEDYHYQNCTDRPEGVTAQAWRHREKVWDAIFAGPNERPNQVSLNICSASDFYLIDPIYDLGDEYRGKGVTFPTMEELAVRDLKMDRKFFPGVKADVVGPGLIQGENDVMIATADGGWVAKVGDETKEGEVLRDLVGWVKTHFLTEADKAYLERLRKSI